MRYEIVKDPAILCKIREELTTTFRNYNQKLGRSVSYGMPALRTPFPLLEKEIMGSKHREQYYHIYYYIETKSRYIKKLVPVPEYYKSAFAAVAEKLYSLQCSINNINDCIKRINEYHKKTRIVREKTGQPFFELSTTEVYLLKTELSNSLFVARSIMDTLATLMHFMYGKGAKQFTSFADFAKYLSKKTSSKGDIVDLEMKEYISSEMEWFNLLRDLRDYFTHCGTFRIEFYETIPTQLSIYIDGYNELVPTLKQILDGIMRYIDYFDRHFVKKVKNYISL